MRSLAVTLLLVAVLASTGCAAEVTSPVAPGPPVGATLGDGPAAAAGLPVDLPYDSGLPAGRGVEWVTIFDPVEVTSSDADDAVRTWTHIATGCDLTVGQARVDATAGADDRSASDAALATWLGVAPADLSAAAFDSPLPRGGQPGEVDARAVFTALENGRHEFAQARAFRDRGVALLLSVTCPADLEVRAAVDWFRDGHVIAQLVPA